MIAEKLKVFDAEGLTLTRYGRDNDGGYVCADELIEQSDTLFSFGIADDISFEKEFARVSEAKQIYLFDPSVNAPPDMSPQMEFFKYGLAKQNRENMRTLDYCMTFGHAPEHAMLKMDIEWGEWEVLESLRHGQLSRFEQIVCELHFIPLRFNGDDLSPYFTDFFKRVHTSVSGGLYSLYARALDKLLLSHKIIHLHANNSLPVMDIGNEKMPPLIELTLVRNDLAKFTPTPDSKIYLPGLDMPNKPYKPELF